MARLAADQKQLYELEAYYAEQIRLCEASRHTRQASCFTLKDWYDHGNPAGAEATNNKLQSHLDRVGSHLWSAEGVRFSLNLPPASRATWAPHATVAREEFRQSWSGSGGNDVLDLSVEWSLVYGATVNKVLPSPEGFTVAYIDPWDFGMTREDQGLDEQDMLAHWYTLSIPQFERWVTGHPRQVELLALAQDHKSTPASYSQRYRFVVSGTTGTFPNTVISGSFPGAATESPDILDPEVLEPVVQLVDLWERKLFLDTIDKKYYEDWDCITLIAPAAGGRLLLRRRNPVVPRIRVGPNLIMPGDHPFSMVVPRPLPNYVWGRSELARLLRLQLKHEDHMERMGETAERALHPARFFSGIADFEEAGRALDAIGGSYGSNEPTAKVDEFKPQLGQDSFAWLETLDKQFDDASGLPRTAQGEAPPNVRAGNQLVTAAGIGAARIRRMALRVEGTVSRTATLGFRVLQRTDSQPYPGPNGETFLLAQLPPEVTVSVSAHSASPIFMEQTESKAMALKQGGAINGEWLVELLDPPYREELKASARQIEEAKAARDKQLLEIQAARYSRRGK